MNVVRGDLTTIDIAADLWVEMVKESRPEWEPNKSWWMDIAARNMVAGHYFQLFVIDDDDVCGFGDFFLFPEPSTGRLHCTGQHLYVKPEKRGTAAASRLVKAWYRTAKESGADTVELFAFYDEQDRWNKVGFEPVRVLMRKEI